MSIDPDTASLAGKLKATLERRFGDELAAVYLFGSRARGEHRPDSDLDLAVVLRRPEHALKAADRELLDVIYPFELESGLHIQAWALPADSPKAGGLRTRLATTIQREGIPI
jgi:predicted nucleotidyltransferase